MCIPALNTAFPLPKVIDCTSAITDDLNLDVFPTWTRQCLLSKNLTRRTFSSASGAERVTTEIIRENSVDITS